MEENKLKKFLNQVSGKESDDIINELDVEQLQVLMSLPDEGLSETVQNVQETLTAKGYDIKEASVMALFEKGYLKWVRVGETFSVCQSLCGKVNKDAIVRRYVDLQRGGDGSESFEALLEENRPR